MKEGGKYGDIWEAKRWGLYPRKGALVEGSDADMVIVDLDKSAVVDGELLAEPGGRNYLPRYEGGVPRA